MPKTGLILDDVFQDHLTGVKHPERPERLRAITSALTTRGLAQQCHRLTPKPLHPSNVKRTHTDAYLQRLTNACENNARYIDTPDSAICPQSYELALLAAGSVTHAVDEVMSGRITNAFCAIRPPGHHAERDRSMGFCMLANVAIAVDHLRQAHNIQRVLILDWDVHHGNGTQHILEQDPDAMFISIHGHPAHVYPGTGYPEERGIGPGKGATLNVPMNPMSGDQEYRLAFDREIRRILESFDAEFVLLSAGFDAHRLDPLAPINLETESYDWMTRAILDAADHHCDGRLVSVLEGGYHLDALAESVSSHLSLLIDRADRASKN